MGFGASLPGLPDLSPCQDLARGKKELQGRDQKLPEMRLFSCQTRDRVFPGPSESQLVRTSPFSPSPCFPLDSDAQARNSVLARSHRLGSEGRATVALFQEMLPFGKIRTGRDLTPISIISLLFAMALIQEELSSPQCWRDEGSTSLL